MICKCRQRVCRDESHDEQADVDDRLAFEDREGCRGQADAAAPTPVRRQQCNVFSGCRVRWFREDTTVLVWLLVLCWASERIFVSLMSGASWCWCELVLVRAGVWCELVLVLVLVRAGVWCELVLVLVLVLVRTGSTCGSTRSLAWSRRRPAW